MYAVNYIKELLLHTVKLLVKREHDDFINGFKKEIFSGNTLVPEVIRSYHYDLLRNGTFLEKRSPGAGSRKGKKTFTVSEYVKRTAVSTAKGNLLLRIAARYKPELIIELGTSFGISTMYMATGCPDSHIITVEGNPQIADISTAAFEEHRFNRVEVIQSLFDDALPGLVQKTNPNTMVFIDGNHTYNATRKYVNAFSDAGLIVLDDIRWSVEMMKVWNEIVSKHSDAFYIDLFSMGIIIREKGRRLYRLFL